MAETFSYDNTPDAEVLTAEEQNSLEVGEELVAEQEQLLAGKYKSAEELENAYLSLQKKLGQTEEEEEVDYERSDEGYEEEEGSDEEVSEYAPAVSLITEASEEYYANDGQLSEDGLYQMKKPSKIERFPQDNELSEAQVNLVNAYLRNPN